MAAEVQEEVAWPKKSENKGQKDETPLQNLQREPPHKPIEITLDTEVETRSDPVASDAAVSASLSPTFPAPTCDLEPSLPGTFIQVESSQTVPQPKSPIPRPPAILTPGTFNLSRRRTAGRTLPIDVALAMQMRPGLGVGADPAWMVRFLMAVFSWFAIMVAGRGGEVDVYAL
ncbi:hypothetical protein AMATHDRAFT_137343 [Amanita thiersii Skay4041]|uniref:Uncharacterized protein n=1 Tax=Amanita thiersii Skay4041 TaxID=703135 RepID=A0A2A9NZI4_9AGAR|nr:hypothetical protein AMATHDRAFT_137343 [Amanita thiersii Skay4041]